MNREGEVIGQVTGIQNNGETVKEAKKGDEVAVGIDGANVGRNVKEGEHLFSCIPLKHLQGISKYLGELSPEEKTLLDKTRELLRVDEEGEEEASE